MELIPESVQGANTLALDYTFLSRLSSLAVDRLAVDLERENDMLKLTLYLQQFGIPLELISDLGAIQFRDLLQRVLRIYRLSGTTRSIELLAEAMGASAAVVVRNAFVLNHARQARHNNMFRYDSGREYVAFSVDVRVGGIEIAELNAYTNTFRRLFNVFQPVSIHLRNVICDDVK